MDKDNSFLEMARVTHLLREPVLQSAIDALELPSGSCGLDAGCGVGLETLMLAESVGPEGHVTGVDLSPEMVTHAENTARQTGQSYRVSFVQGDVRSLPYDEDSVDWSWSADCVGYAPIDPIPVVEELARVTKPGGTVAILAWSHETLLPGYPELEARLRSTAAGIAPFVKGKTPASHFLRALGWFRLIGMENPAALVFAGGVHAPLHDDHRKALSMLFEMRWPDVEPELSASEYKQFLEICQPDSPDFVVNHPDYCAFFTYSMFRGTVPRR